MPELPDELFLGSLQALLSVDSEWVPAAGGEDSLYLRPFMIATSTGLGVNSPAADYVYTVIASPAGSYFSGGVKPVSVWLSTEYVRAAPGGTATRPAAHRANDARSRVQHIPTSRQGHPATAQ